jgi:hypothetical protein
LEKQKVAAPNANGNLRLENVMKPQAKSRILPMERLAQDEGCSESSSGLKNAAIDCRHLGRVRLLGQAAPQTVAGVQPDPPSRES